MLFHHRGLMSLSLVSITVTIALLSMPLQADTDDADSLDFESFHAEDNTLQTFKNQPLLSKRNTKEKTHTTSTTYNTQDALTFLQSQIKLYKAMDSECPNGWVKKEESSLLLGEQRQLTFSFNCVKFPAQ